MLVKIGDWLNHLICHYCTASKEYIVPLPQKSPIRNEFEPLFFEIYRLMAVFLVVMKIPSRIKVLYNEYTVRQEENLHMEDSELFGKVDDLSQEVVLNAGTSEEQKTNQDG